MTDYDAPDAVNRLMQIAADWIKRNEPALEARLQDRQELLITCGKAVETAFTNLSVKHGDTFVYETLRDCYRALIDDDPLGKLAGDESMIIAEVNRQMAILTEPSPEETSCEEA